MLRALWLLSLLLVFGCAGAPGAKEPAQFAADVAVVNDPGEWVDVDRLPVPGKVTAIDFYADWCDPCKDVGARLLELSRREPGLAVRKVNVGSMLSAVAEGYRIEALPLVFLYDADGERRRVLVGRHAQKSAQAAQKLLSEALSRRP